MRRTFLTLLALAGAAATLPWAGPAIAHPGGLNGEGCHNNRKTGGYHCHRSGRASQPVATAQSIDGRVYYANCAAVRATGKAPLRRGDPGYRAGLDRDDDGIACEV